MSDENVPRRARNEDRLQSLFALLVVSGLALVLLAIPLVGRSKARQSAVSRRHPVAGTIGAKNSLATPRGLRLVANKRRRPTPTPAPARRPTPSPAVTTTPTPTTASMVVLGYNDLGMHCINQDFSQLVILPPYNNLHAQVIDRSGEDPRIVTGGVTVAYSVPGNTTSASKTNFWLFAPAIFGKTLPLNIGLTGNGLSGTMKPTPDGDWAATGIPLTPVTDAGTWNPFQLSSIKVLNNRSQLLASTEAVVPVSWEIRCDLCHNNPAVTPYVDILQKHDRLHATNLVGHQPVLCASCHADPALGTTGNPSLHTLSSAMHTSHAPRMNLIPQLANKCYACHPGIHTQCLRDVHFAAGMTCTDCHTSMAAVGDPARTPWVSEPRCDNCHHTPGHSYEQPGKLFKDSKGHNGVKCSSCHGSPHAILPTVTPADNQQSILLQGHPGTISDCRVCHRQQPDDAFNHSLGDGGDGGAGGGND